jgi:hypothetical protein
MGDAVAENLTTTPTAQPATETALTDDGCTAWAWRNGRLFRSSRPFPWVEHESFETALERIGFSKDAAISLADPGDVVVINVFERPAHRDETPERLADVTFGGYSYLVWLDGLEEFVDFLTRMTPMVASVALLSDRSENLARELYEDKLARRGGR